MEIPDDRFTEFLGEFREFKGEVRADIKNMGEHLGAVSKKADRIRDELDTHKRDQEAHGLGGERRASGHVREWLGWVVAAGGLAVALLKVKWGG